MKENELKNWIDSLTDDIEFLYHGVQGSVCPINRAEIYLSYGTETYDATSVEDAMDATLFDGKSLHQISDELDFM